MNTNKHTPTPWKSDGYWIRQSGPNGTRMVADICYTGPHHTPADEYPESCRIVDKANAEFIVRACNCHDELVEALQAQEDAEEWIANADQNDPFFEETYRHKLNFCADLRSKALAKARKGEP